MSKLPVEALERISDEFQQDQVVVLTHDRSRNVTTVATYGASIQDKLDAARAGEFIKRPLGWPPEARGAVPAAALAAGRLLCEACDAGRPK